MKISVITVSLNNSSTISDTIDSVLNQNYKDFEHLVIDGKSTDGTLNILQNSMHSRLSVSSEIDGGIYDAMNKGLELSNGEIIGFLNADDFYPSSLVLSKVVKVFEDKKIDACYGDLCYVRKNNIKQIVRYWKSSALSDGAFVKGWSPPHPTFFVRKSIYQNFGGFNLDYKIAADLELMMRFLVKHKISAKYIPEVLVHMRMGGTTNKSLGNILRQNKEILYALRSHGQRSSVWLLIFYKFFSRGWQFFVRPI